MLENNIASRFDLLEEVGHGAQGVVYRAFDRLEHRIVALKSLALRSSESMYELKREFRSISQTRHPHLVQLYDLFVEKDAVFFTMEFVDGVSIVDYLRPDGKLSLDRAKRTFGQLFLGIQAVHRTQRIHRDLKPSNVMVEEDGRVVILDFGLVTPLEPQEMSVTSDWGLAGTLPYMPPEAFDGLPPNPDWDWYAAGAIMYECLIGEPPFSPPFSRLLEAKKSPIAADERLGPWSDLVVRSMSPEPDRRPSVEELEIAFDAKALHVFAEPRFLGRRAELDALQAMWRSSGLRIASVGGHGGIGKSALLSEFARRVAEGGGRVLTSRCRPNETVAFEVLDGLVDGLSRSIQTEELTVALEQRDRAALVQLFPIFRGVRMEDSGPEPVVEEEAPAQLRRRAANALRQLLNSVAKSRPLLLRIEDVQWASPDSAAFFGMVFGTEEPVHAMVVLSYRPETDRPMLKEIEGWQQSWASLGVHWQTFDLRPLPPDVLNALLDTQLPAGTEEPTLRAWISEQSGGNPFLAEELCRAAMTSSEPLVGRPLEEALLARVDALTTVPRNVLTCVAVSGRALHRGVLVRCADDRRAAERSLGELLAQRFLRDVSSGQMTAVDVYHDRLRDALDQSATDEAIKTCHSRLADALAETNADPRELVGHLLRAGRTGEAATQAIEAALLSNRRLEFDREARFLEIALQHGELAPETRRRRERELAEALANAGRGKASADVWKKLSRVDNQGEARFAERRAAALYLGSGHISLGYRVLDGVLRRAGLRLPSSPQKSLFAVLWLRLRIWLQGYRLRSPISNPSLEEHADVCWEASEMLSMVDTVRGSVFQARNMLTSLRLGDRYRLARALGIEVAYLGATGWFKWPRIQRLSNLAVQASEEDGRDHGKAIAIGGTGVALYFHGRWREALAHCEEADVIYRRCLGVTWERDTTALFVLMCLLRLGKLPQAHTRALVEVESAIDRGDLFLETYTKIRILAPLLIAFGKPDSAEALLDEAMAKWATVGYQVQEFWAAYSRTVLALDRGDYQAARELAEQTLQDLGQSYLNSLIEFRIETMAHAARACVGLARRGDDTARTAARRHIKPLLRSKVDWPNAYGLALSGCIARLEGNDAQAIADLEQASERFEDLELPLDAAVSGHVCGRIQGGPEGQAIVDHATGVMREAGIANPSHYADTWLPVLAEET